MSQFMPRWNRASMIWTGWVIAALLLLPWVTGTGYLAAIVVSALVLAIVPGAVPRTRGPAGRRDLLAMAAMYLAVVALLRLAFVGFTTDNIPGLFLSFAAGLLLGVAGPVIYTVWSRKGSLADLGIRRDNWKPTVTLGLMFAAVQFALTLWGFDYPAAEDWVPLLVMALVVGVFESVFFRGFVQNRLQAQFGSVAGVAGAALLYGLYHVGYGMGGTEILFLTGLGIVYAVAFAIAENLFVLWPLLTPLGSFYANASAGDIDLPWAAIAGFADVLILMVVVLWFANRHERRRRQPAVEAQSAVMTDR